VCDLGFFICKKQSLFEPMSKNHNEDTRVKIPAILHLMRLGYEYVSLKDAVYDEENNIFTDIFKESIARINPNLSVGDIARWYKEVALSLENEDLGKVFCESLMATSGKKLIDFENFANNSFHVCTELTYKNGEDEFRPDVICLINGMPLVFIEVKKPNNKNGVIAERSRINDRFKNKRFRKFVNLTQFMIFSNNMEYDDNEIEPWQGAYYASASYGNPIFNYFREEIGFNLQQLLLPEDAIDEDVVLKDNNYQTLKHIPEFADNKKPDTITNAMLSSMLSRERLAFILQYGLAYVKETSGLQKHIMRYPQLFATKAIESKLDQGIRKGIIWHTQGSGKTALAYYNTHFLTDYFQKQGVIAKFYFIVDRIDLAIQASDEFTKRGLKVHKVSSREAFAKDLKKAGAVDNDKGLREITVVNIHKFQDDPNATTPTDYDINVQRVYFLDEVHRSYNPKGSFLANLQQSDQNAIKIGLTGTPLIGETLSSKYLFGDYIHKYYYNKSIADGYTLKLIREEIETEYKATLQKALDELEFKKGSGNKKLVTAHPSYVEPLLDYIVRDFEKMRRTENDSSIGAMVICDSSEQATMLYQIFNDKYAFAKAEQEEETNGLLKAAEEPTSYITKLADSHKVKRAELILHNSGSKDELKAWRESFKDGDVDILFVYNMLLTGFDAKRLKKLYLTRVIKSHNLLQALTRVNRAYKSYKYGYVVDFADISKEFDKTNKDYFDELQDVLGTEEEHYSNLFMSRDEMQERIVAAKEVLADYNLSNREVFSQQINQISDVDKVAELKKALEDVRVLYNMIRLVGEYDLLESMDFTTLSDLRIEASNRHQLLNAKDAMQNNEEVGNLLNLALEDIMFDFHKVGEEELILGDQLKNTLKRTREGLASNFDPKDPEYITLYEELKRLFNSKNINEVSQDEMRRNIMDLEKIYSRVKELNRINETLRDKYKGDKKYVRIQKRLLEAGKPSKFKTEIIEALQRVKNETDVTILNRSDTLQNEAYFGRVIAGLVVKEFDRGGNVDIDLETALFITDIIVKEYMDEYYGRTA
jgi:type I restriction enzyme R subunit